jgi:4-amino-4-deoxy-L-arabinose transferase-like glycosyltransferase
MVWFFVYSYTLLLYKDMSPKIDLSLYNTQKSFQQWCFLFLLLMILLLFLKLGSWGVIETSEARYAEISKEMYQSKDLIHPRMLGILHYHKPPVIYWITTFAYSIFGTTEFAARFFLQVVYFLQVILIYRIALLIFNDKRTSLYAAIVYATLPMVLISIRGLTTDAYVNTIILGAILSWLSFIKHQKIIYIYTTTLLLGIGFLTKGPVPWIYAGAVILGTFTFASNFKKYWIHYLIGIIITLPLAFSWYIQIISENSHLRDYFLFHHTVERFTNASTFKRAEPWWYYIAVLPAVMLTWFLILIVGMIQNKLGDMPLLIKRIAIWWVLLPFIFFSIASSKLVLYILPIFGGLSILCAYYLSKENFTRRVEYIFLGILILLNTIFGLSPFYKDLSLPIWLSLIPLVSLIMMIVICRFKTSFNVSARLCLYAMAFTVALIPFSTMFMSNNELVVNSIKPVAAWLKEEKLDERKILVYDELLPSLAFQLGNATIISLYDGNQSAAREVQFEQDDNWQRNLIDLTSNDANRINTANSVLLIKKGKLKAHSQWLSSMYQANKTIGKWVIYY